MTPFIGFVPDIAPETEGAILDCSNVLPCVGGFEPAKSRIDSSHGALTSAAVGFAVVRKTDNTARVFCGDSGKLYEAVSGTWTDRSKVGGYTLGPNDRWRIAQFGNASLAANKSTTIQSSSSTTFADVSASAPKAAILETLNNQVFAFNINGMGLGDAPNGWGCSAIGSETDWTPAVATQCVAGKLLDTPGPITSGRRLGEYIVIYKERAMYIGSYVGAPVVWDIRRIPGDIGTPVHEAVVNTGTAHYFIGSDDFYVFDGSRPQVLVSALRNWFFDTVDQANLDKVWGTFDRINQRVFWWFPSSSSGGVLDKCIVYNIKTNQWGKMDGEIQCAAEFVTTGVTFEGLGTLYATYDDLPTDISYDSSFWSAGAAVLSVFGTDKKMYQYSGTPNNSSITTWNIGDNIVYSTITKVRPRFIRLPTSSTIYHSYSNDDADSFVSGSSSDYSGKWYDLLWSARWHKLQIDFVGDYKIAGIDVIRSMDGIE